MFPASPSEVMYDMFGFRPDLAGIVIIVVLAFILRGLVLKTGSSLARRFLISAVIIVIVIVAISAYMISML